MKKIRVGIMTFFRVNNYGAVLQAYSLSRTLAEMELDVELIDYECPFLEKPYRMENLKRRGLFSYLVSLFGYLTRLPRNKKFDRFRKDALNISSTRYGCGRLEDIPYDIVVAGSDQIWNLNATGGDVGYLCEGMRRDLPRYTYAASFGTSSVDEMWYPVLEKNLKTFRKIILREKAGAQIVQSLLPDCKCDTIADPVFLKSRQEWSNLAVEPTCKNYILVYQQSVTKTVVKIARKLAKQKNLKLIFIPFPIGAVAAGKYKTNYSPTEWLGLIQYADYVVTDSFHGAALSIVLNTDFFVSLSGVGMKTGCRIRELLDKMGLQDRYIDDIEKLNSADRTIDWENVNQIISNERERAFAYLEEIKKDTGR